MERVEWDKAADDKTSIFYFISIVMYCISFFYLFCKNLPSENIIFIFVFVLNTIFPFIWMKDLFSIDSEDLFGHRLVLYRNIGVSAALSLQFLSLFFVLLKNENVRKMKLLSVKKDDTNNREKIKDLNTNDKGTEKADRIIYILFVTITTLVWGVIGVAFSENNIIKNQPVSSQFIDTIRWLLNQPYKFINNFETKWQSYMEMIDVSPLVKAFGMYCATFLLTFFGVFVRIPYFKYPRKHNPMDLFNIVNMRPLFPPFFIRNLHKFRELSVFFLSLIVSLCFAGIMFTLKSYFHWIPKNLIIASTIIGFALFFGCFFGKRLEMFPDASSVKNLIFFLLCVIFSFIGTPVVLAGVQLLMESGLLTILQKIFITMWCNLSRKTHCGNLPLMVTLNSDGILEMFAGVIGTVLLFTIYGLGVDKKWVSNANGKSMQMFLVTLITMTFALYMALNTKYKVNLALYELLKTIIQFATVYITPLTVVALAITQLVFAFRNYMKYKRFEKLKV